MLEDKTEDRADVKIGELLLAVGVVSSGDLQEAIQIAKRMSLPMGRVIVMSGLISEANLHFALEAQSLIRDGLVDMKMAISALKMAYDSNKTLHEALAEMHWAPKKDQQSNKLGELLIESAMINQVQLEAALQSCVDTGMPLGGILVSQGVISAPLLQSVLDAQEQIRQGKIDRQRAMENLKTAFMYWSRTTTAQEGRGQFLSEHIEDLSDLSFSPSTKTEYLSTNDRVLTKESENVPSILELVSASGYASEVDVKQAMLQSFQNVELAMQVFVATGLLDLASLDDIVRCCRYLVKGLINEEQAVRALSACRARGISMVRALQDMGINVPLE